MGTPGGVTIRSRERGLDSVLGEWALVGEGPSAEGESEHFQEQSMVTVVKVIIHRL